MSYVDNGYVMLEPFTTPINLTDPSNLFFLQDTVMTNLNAFETTYDRFMRCSNLTVAPTVNPPCDVAVDNISNLDVVYSNLLHSIADLSKAFVGQALTNAETPEQYDQIHQTLDASYQNMVQFRQMLDSKLNQLNESRMNGTGSPVRLLESAAFANTLWIILASCLIYYIIVEL
jgi:hypothetical protein